MLATFQLHPLVPVTLTLPVPPPGAKELLAGEMEYMQIAVTKASKPPLWESSYGLPAVGKSVDSIYPVT